MIALPAIPFDPKTVRPDLSFEKAVWEQGVSRLAGCDEAGRGPLAGPVVAALVVLNPDDVPEGMNDSKKLSDTRLRALYHQIVRRAEVGVGIVSSAEIDRVNILQATFLAMTRAADALESPAEFVIVDGNAVPPALKGRAASLVKGDARSLSISAASIVAKVVRDRIMQLADMRWPGYGFADHVGYGAPAHYAAIEKLGPCPIHRMSFRPFKDMARAA
ncbi:ribonuclease HII [Rhizobium leguminosarum]|jgi:ribonuclease HII|uniref:ribonuclease HII n=1 Tax=Rhizobium leguminosarum TaxID=384 RepID=UPI002E13F7A9|nr:ribonuclease HII [Rhizobium leguminosarum]WSH77406.1 ribonuclease HII [Rhizobium leguminosarum]